MEHFYAQMMENSLRIERMQRRGSMLGGLGQIPASGPPRLFRRTVLPLAAEVVVVHAVSTAREAAASQLAPRAA